MKCVPGGISLTPLNLVPIFQKVLSIPAIMLNIIQLKI